MATKAQRTLLEPQIKTQTGKNHQQIKCKQLRMVNGARVRVTKEKEHILVTLSFLSSEPKSQTVCRCEATEINERIHSWRKEKPFKLDLMKPSIYGYEYMQPLLKLTLEVNFVISFRFAFARTRSLGWLSRHHRHIFDNKIPVQTTATISGRIILNFARNNMNCRQNFDFNHKIRSKKTRMRLKIPQK